MYKMTDNELTQMGAVITTREIQQEPELWLETFKIYQEKKQAIDAFLGKIESEFNEPVRVIFT
ncbi:tagatose-6-phosphate ketose isomerase, partial [Enterococcus faecium]|nr:tagatose-6-phosphate ketose isomerase [Enterococcus faecium]